MSTVESPTKVNHYPLYINGESVEAQSGKKFEVFNPTTGQVIATVSQAGSEDVDKAVKAARAAFPSWSQTPAAMRSVLINKLADLLEANLPEFAALETQNNGKPINESTYVDLPMTVDCFRFYAAAARTIKGETHPNPGMMLYTRKEPLGVIGQIIPWNFPIMMVSWKLGPALAAGNTVVLKPAEQTPLTALKLAELIKEAGFPDGVVNIVTGFGDTGQAIVEHEDVDKIAFTGSTEVGKLIMEKASKTLKKVTLELGGKSPNVVFEDANIEQAIRGALFGIYFNQGQCCTAGSRLFVQESIYDEFVEKFLDKIKSIQMGDPTQPTTQIGPIVSQEQYDRVKNYVKIGQEEGATLAHGGVSPDGELANGWFVEPTVFTNVTNDMKIAQEEIFGPVVSIIKFKDEAEAEHLVNDIAYGLASAIWTENLKRAHNFAGKIKAGYVWVNTYNVLPIEAPFGGYKQSGIGREFGLGSLDAYTETKTVLVDLNEASPITGWYRV